MITVFKYTLMDYGFVKRVEMPADAQLLHAGYQGNVLCVWAKVDSRKPKRTRIIHLTGTGSPAPDCPHIATVHAPDGFHIWHLWDAGYLPD